MFEKVEPELPETSNYQTRAGSATCELRIETLARERSQPTCSSSLTEKVEANANREYPDRLDRER
jgi:hypothetical protein